MKKRSRMLFFLTSCTVLLSFFIFFFNSKATLAYFTDRVTMDSAIELSLGTIQLEAESLFLDETTIVAADQKTKLDDYHLMNNGTLNGKLAYKITVVNSNNKPISSDQLTLMMAFNGTNEKKADYNDDKYHFFPESSLAVDSKESVNTTLYSVFSSLPDIKQELTIKTTFLLVQSNATVPKEQAFFDTKTMSKKVVVKDKQNEFEDAAYWPAKNAKGWKKTDSDHVHYHLETFQERLFFSSTKDNNRIKTLKDSIIYVDIEEGYKVDSRSIELITEKKYLEFRYELVDNNPNKLKLIISIKEDAPLQHYATYFDDDGYKFEFRVVGLNDKKEKKIQIAKDDKFPITLSKMMLSSDYLKPRYYYERPIYIFGEPKTIELQYSAKKQKNEDKMKNSFTTIDFKELGITPIAKITSNNANAAIQQDDTIPGRFNLSEMNQSKSSTSKEAELKITFPGASGKNLEVNRSVVYLPYTKNTEKWPKLTNGQKVSYHHLEEQHKIELFLANPNQEELTFGLTKDKDNEQFVIKEQVYSADGSMMKVTVEYESVKNNEKSKLKYEVSYNDEKSKLKYEVSYNDEKGKTGYSDEYKFYTKEKQLNESARYTFEDKTESVANSASHQLASDKKDFERKAIIDSSTKEASETDKVDSSSSDSSLPLEEKSEKKEVSVQEEQSVKEEQNKITYQNQAGSETSLEHVTAHLQEIEEDRQITYRNDKVIELFIPTPNQTKLDFVLNNQIAENERFYVSDKTYNSEKTIMKISIGFQTTQLTEPSLKEFAYSVNTNQPFQEKVQIMMEK